jgi:hypothetical protein
MRSVLNFLHNYIQGLAMIWGTKDWVFLIFLKVYGASPIMIWAYVILHLVIALGYALGFIGIHEEE